MQNFFAFFNQASNFVRDALFCVYAVHQIYKKFRERKDGKRKMFFKSSSGQWWLIWFRFVLKKKIERKRSGPCKAWSASEIWAQNIYPNAKSWICNDNLQICNLKTRLWCKCKIAINWFDGLGIFGNVMQKRICVTSLVWCTTEKRANWIAATLGT